MEENHIYKHRVFELRDRLPETTYKRKLVGFTRSYELKFKHLLRSNTDGNVNEW